MVALSTGDVTSGIKRTLVVKIDVPPQSTFSKNGYNFQTVHARQAVCIEH
jgi:hypothetical protein